MALSPVHAIFVAHGTRSICHYSTVGRTEGILQTGSILARAELERRGIGCDSTHYYGDDEKQAILTEYVSCATMPPWGMMGGETEELVILEITPAAVMTPGTCFCPGWSPQGRFSAEEIVSSTGPEHAEALYSGPGYQTVPGAEIFVPGAIDVAQVQRMVFFDRESMDRALPRLRAAAEAAGSAIPADHSITVTTGPYRFPRNWQTEGPPWLLDQESDEPLL